MTDREFTSFAPIAQGEFDGAVRDRAVGECFAIARQQQLVITAQPVATLQDAPRGWLIVGRARPADSSDYPQEAS